MSLFFDRTCCPMWDTEEVPSEGDCRLSWSFSARVTKLYALFIFPPLVLRRLTGLRGSRFVADCLFRKLNLASAALRTVSCFEFRYLVQIVGTWLIDLKRSLVLQLLFILSIPTHVATGRLTCVLEHYFHLKCNLASLFWSHLSSSRHVSRIIFFWWSGILRFSHLCCSTVVADS